MPAVKPSHFRKIPVTAIVTAEQPVPFLRVIRSHWWSVTDDDCVLIYVGPGQKYNSPQCNINRSIVERLQTCPGVPTQPKFLPWAYLPVNPSDYV